MQEYQDEIVARLSGAMVLPSGETLADRETGANRAEAADYLFDAFADLGLSPQLHEYSGEAAGTNVYAQLAPTTDSTEVVVVGAHFDTVPGSPGANDNATGVAMVLSLARYLIELPCRDQGVIFVVFDQEEIGLVGSYEFGGLLATSNLDIVAVHTIDQMGWDDDGDRTLEVERADADLFQFYEPAASDLGVPLSPTSTGFTDHVSFREWGFTAVGLTEEFVGGDTTPHYHLGTDSYATVNFDYLTSSTTLLHEAFARAVAG
jgi:Zn-dependent M28 family amino/carboxypeptidase